MTGRQSTTRIRRARNALAAERERTIAERDAFETFSRRVEALRPGRPDTRGGLVGFARSLSGGSSSPSALDRVRRAYRETVMAMAHYDEEYGEPVGESIAAEFGTEIGAAVAESGVFTAELKAALSGGARDAAGRRATFLDVLDEEREALDDAARELCEIQAATAGLDADGGRHHGRDRDSGAGRRGRRASFGSLQATRDRLCELDERCEALVAARQRRLRAPRAGGQWRNGEDLSLNEYLYGILDVTHPVLADASSVAATVREKRRRIERALTHTV